MRKKKSIVIVGLGARSFEWLSTDEVWVISSAALVDLPERWHRWFHLHGIEHIRAVAHLREIDWLENSLSEFPGKRVYTPRGKPKGTLAFPYSKVIRSCGFSPTATPPHFHNSFPILIAYAVLEGATSITLDGVQFGYDKPAEAWVIPAIEWHLGRAVGLGIKVRVPLGSGLMESHHVYGLEGPGSI